MVDWYREVLGFKIIKQFQTDYHYSNLETSSGIRVGIAEIKYEGVVLDESARNSIVIQFEVNDVEKFFAHLEKKGVKISGGPSFDRKDNFWFGSFLDPDGNLYWVVDENCP
jgi:uncharacterized glyoxalase superfamily protein PhnB